MNWCPYREGTESQAAQLLSDRRRDSGPGQPSPDCALPTGVLFLTAHVVTTVTVH